MKVFKRTLTLLVVLLTSVLLISCLGGTKDTDEYYEIDIPPLQDPKIKDYRITIYDEKERSEFISVRDIDYIRVYKNVPKIEVKYLPIEFMSGAKYHVVETYYHIYKISISWEEW